MSGRGLPVDALAELERLQPMLGARASLCPDRPCAPTPVALAQQVVEGSGDVERARAFARGLGEIIRTIAEDFPDNVFWDLDYLACCLWRAGEAPAISKFAERVRTLCRRFGARSALRFRYAHDFLYGYDWARWVKRQPEERAAVGPFDIAFFDYLDGRCQELVGLVANNDAKYCKLEGRAFRNPFTFSREPREEALLHQVLAHADLIPVKAWRLDGERCWDMPFTDLRAEAAEHLGLSHRAVS